MHKCGATVMRLIISALFALQSLLLLLPQTAECATQTLELFTEFSSAAPCSGLFNVNGFVGCSSKKDTSLNVASALYFPNEARFREAIQANAFTGVWVIPVSTWCNLSRADLESLNPLATSLIIVESADAPPPCPSAGFDSDWNQFGTDITRASLSYPVARLNQSDGDKLQALIDSAGDRKVRFEFYMGQSTANTSYCLDIQMCSPLGGLSVWGTVHSPPLASSEDVFLLAANMDSTAFFHDLAPGFHASGGDIALVLASSQALAAAPLTPARIVTAIFQGEAFGRIGSRRFIEDLALGTCRNLTKASNSSCADPPNFNLEFTRFQGRVDRIKGVIALSNVLRFDNAINSSYVTGVESSSGISDDLAARLSLELSKLGWDAPAAQMKPSAELPPSVLSSFAERPDWNETGGVVLTGFGNDRSEANPHFETEDDVLDMTRFETYVDQATLFATALSRTLFFMASNGTESELVADRDLVAALLKCFGGSFTTDCPMALSALNQTSARLANVVAGSAPSADRPFAASLSLPLTSYASVYSPFAVVNGRVKLREAFIRNVMANLTVNGTIPPPRTGTFFSCTSDVACRDQWDDLPGCPGSNPAANASAACVGGRCICSTVFFHDAWSPSLALSASGFSVLSGPLLDTEIWTEPTWNPPVLAAFVQISSLDVAVSLVVGILVTVGAAVFIQFVKLRQDSFSKVKLA